MSKQKQSYYFVMVNEYDGDEWKLLEAGGYSYPTKGAAECAAETYLNDNNDGNVMIILGEIVTVDICTTSSVKIL